jgi:hypothetical protein
MSSALECLLSVVERSYRRHDPNRRIKEASANTGSPMHAFVA